MDYISNYAFDLLDLPVEQEGMEVFAVRLSHQVFPSLIELSRAEDFLDENIDTGFEDRFIREAMFGGEFGAFRTSGCHFFDPIHPTYIRIAAIARIRNSQGLEGLALRKGRQYLREISFLNKQFSLPAPGELIAWSRLLLNQEVLVTLNTHGTESRGALITVDASLHPDGSHLKFLYRSDWTEAELADPPQNETAVVQYQDGRASVRIDLPPAGMAILA